MTQGAEERAARSCDIQRYLTVATRGHARFCLRSRRCKVRSLVLGFVETARRFGQRDFQTLPSSSTAIESPSNTCGMSTTIVPVRRQRRRRRRLPFASLPRDPRPIARVKAPRASSEKRTHASRTSCTYAPSSFTISYQHLFYLAQNKHDRNGPKVHGRIRLYFD